MNIARIKNNRVINIEVWDFFPTEQGFEFVNITGQPVTIGYFYEDSVFYSPKIIVKVRVLDNGVEEIFEASHVPTNVTEYFYIEVTNKKIPSKDMIYNSETGEFE